MTSLSNAKFKRIFNLERGHKGLIACKQKNTNIAAIKTRRSMSVHWVACGTCYSETGGTELGGIELSMRFVFQEIKVVFA